ncbi:hypothetical protein GJ496_007666 [Pomphorhynchus laevis]|nr:hypothetical protein GJ496_007666 [Pomphorhynchus laevis]
MLELSLIEMACRVHWNQIPRPCIPGSKSTISMNASSQLYTLKRGRCLHKIHHTVDRDIIPISYEKGFQQNKACRYIRELKLSYDR